MSSPPQFLRAIWKNDHFIKQVPPLSPCRLFTYLFFNRYSPEKDDISLWLRGPEGQQMRVALWSRSCECAQAVPEAQLLPLAVPKKRIWDLSSEVWALGTTRTPAPSSQNPGGYSLSAGFSELLWIHSTSTGPALCLQVQWLCLCCVLNRTGLSSALST